VLAAEAEVVLLHALCRSAVKLAFVRGEASSGGFFCVCFLVGDWNVWEAGLCPIACGKILDQ